MNESEIAALIGTRDGHTIASRFLQLLDSGELDPAKDQEVDSAAERITDEVVAESAKRYGPDTILSRAMPTCSPRVKPCMNRSLGGYGAYSFATRNALEPQDDTAFRRDTPDPLFLVNSSIRLYFVVGSLTDIRLARYK